MLKTGDWTVSIRVTDHRVQALVINHVTGNNRFYERSYADFEDGPRWRSYDEAIGECLTEVRDTFDEV